MGTNCQWFIEPKEGILQQWLDSGIFSHPEKSVYSDSTTYHMNVTQEDLSLPLDEWDAKSIYLWATIFKDRPVISIYSFQRAYLWQGSGSYPWIRLYCKKLYRWLEPHCKHILLLSDQTDDDRFTSLDEEYIKEHSYIFRYKILDD